MNIFSFVYYVSLSNTSFNSLFFSNVLICFIYTDRSCVNDEWHGKTAILPFPPSFPPSFPQPPDAQSCINATCAVTNRLASCMWAEFIETCFGLGMWHACACSGNTAYMCKLWGLYLQCYPIVHHPLNQIRLQTYIFPGSNTHWGGFSPSTL